MLNLYPRQQEVVDACAPGKRNIILLSGPRMASKSIGSLAALCSRAWRLKRRKICILSITQAVGTDSGVWSVLTDKVIPQCIVEGGMQWVEKPRLKGAGKTPFCAVTNMYGGVSEFQHRSLKVESEVEDKFKGPEFTDIFVNELSKFRNRKTFTTLLNCLRGLSVPEDELMFLADTNPSDEGMDSWIYKTWYEIPAKDEALLEDWERALRNRLRLIEFSVDDNLGMSPEAKQLLFASLAGDDDLVERYWFGRWVRATTDAIFGRVFRPKFHCIGSLPTANNRASDIMVPEENCVRLCTGWDPGSSANWAMVIGEPYFPPVPKHQGRPSFKILDEHAVVGEQVDYIKFVGVVLRKMAMWERLAGRPVMWTHYSDISVFTMRDLSSDQYYSQLIFEASEGQIKLEGVDRGPGTVQAGVDLIKMLMFDERIWFNLRTCPQLIVALKSIKKGRGLNQAMDKESKYKHICLAGGTLITTARGDVPIELVTGDDLVLTRSGWRRVLCSSCTDESAEVVEMATESGKRIIGTPDHRIVSHGTSIPLSQIQRGDRLVSCNPQKPSFLMGSSSTDSPTQPTELVAFISPQAYLTFVAGFKGFTMRFGSRLTGRSQRGTSSTTETEMLSITPSRIWNALQVRSTPSITRNCLDQSISNDFATECPCCRKWPRRGTEAQRELSGTASTGSKRGSQLPKHSPKFALPAGRTSRTMPLTPLVSFAPTTANLSGGGVAVWITKRENASCAEQNSRPTSTPTVAVADDAVAHVSGILTERRPVFNLTVEDDHEYFANGILVKNCDALRYLLQAECYDELRITVAQRMAKLHEGRSSLVWTPR